MTHDMPTAALRPGMLFRSLILLLLVVCLAPSLFAQDVTVDIQLPRVNSPNGDTLEISTAVTSVWDIASVKANVEGREVSLARIGNLWKGNLSLVGLSYGSHLLTVTAQDVNSTTGTDQVTFRYDNNPTVEISEPLEASVGRPLIRVVASCEDDDTVNPCRIVIQATSPQTGSEQVAAGYSSIDEYISLDAFDGQQVDLIATATDFAGQTASVTRVVYVDGSSRLSQVYEVPGTSVGLGAGLEDDAVILDVDADRILYVGATGMPVIRDRQTGVDTIIPLPGGREAEYGALGPRGAIVQSTTGIFELQDAIVLSHGGIHDSLKTAGRYAIWSTGPSATSNQVLLRDLLLGTTTVVDVGVTPSQLNNDVDEDGNVAVWTPFWNVYRWSAGVATPVATATATTRYLWPIIDGTTVVYRKEHLPEPVLYSIIRNDAGVETELRPPGSLKPSQGLDYLAENGWVAFTKPGASNELKVYRAGLGEPAQQVSFLATNSRIERLAPDGTVVYTSAEGHYFSSTAPPPDRINSELGKTHLIDGIWHLALGRSLFVIQEERPPTTVSLTASVSPAMVGENVTFTATVSESGATGLVVFKDPLWGVLGSAPVSGGTASITVPMPVPGQRSIIAVYGGCEDFAWSISAPRLLNVNATSTTTLTSTPNPSTSGQSVTFTATVTINGSPSTTATGSVQFKDGATTITTRALTNGVAIISTAALSTGTHSMTAVYLGSTYVAGSTSNVVMQQVIPIGTPTSLTATATSPASVALAWSAVTNADHYDIARSVNNGPFAVIASPTGPSYTDTTVSPNLTYLYQVRAVRADAATSPYSAIDPATTVMFNRDPLVAGLHVIKAVDILELRTAVNAMRVSAGLAPIAPSPAPTVGSPVKAVHIQELRTPLNEARTAIGLAAISYVDPTLSAGMTVKAVHVQQLRNGCK